jgi:hypothetical protein
MVDRLYWPAMVLRAAGVVPSIASRPPHVWRELWMLPPTFSPARR